MKINTLQHADVRGNKLWYMSLTTKKGTQHLINIGEKTFNRVNELLQEEADEELFNQIVDVVKEEEKKKK